MEFFYWTAQSLLDSFTGLFSLDGLFLLDFPVLMNFFYWSPQSWWTFFLWTAQSYRKLCWVYKKIDGLFLLDFYWTAQSLLDFFYWTIQSKWTFFTGLPSHDGLFLQKSPVLMDFFYLFSQSYIKLCWVYN